MGDEKLCELALAHHIPAFLPKEEREKDGVWIVTEGHGATITDSDGNHYLDAVGGGTLAVGVGYGRERIARAMYEQAVQLHYIAPYRGVAPVTIELASKLATMTPGSLSAAWFTSGGSEAVESAIKLARQYHIHNGQPGRYKVISRRHAYHGTTAGALSCTGPGPALTQLRALGEPTLMPGVSHICAPYCYRCDLGLEYPSCEVACADELAREIEYQGPDSVSAFIGEPVIGGASLIPPVPEYWPKVRMICDRYGVLLIADEVLTGFGRTGQWFACEHWELVPDILVLGKNISGCYVPLGAAIIRSELYEKMPGFMHVHTFGGHPVAAAAALATLDIMQQERLVEQAAEVGVYMLSGLRTLSSHPTVGEVRGLGMLFGIELVRDKKTKARFPEDIRAAEQVALGTMAHGVLTRAVGGAVLELAPVLTFTKKDSDAVVEALDRSLSDFERQAMPSTP